MWVPSAAKSKQLSGTPANKRRGFMGSPPLSIFGIEIKAIFPDDSLLQIRSKLHV
jgi:hypothetical protein